MLCMLINDTTLVLSSCLLMRISRYVGFLVMSQLLVWRGIAFSFPELTPACVVIANLVPLSLLTTHVFTALIA